MFKPWLAKVTNYTKLETYWTIILAVDNASGTRVGDYFVIKAISLNPSFTYQAEWMGSLLGKKLDQDEIVTLIEFI